MDKPFLGCGVARFHTTEQRGQLGRSTDSTPIVGRGRGLRRWSEIFPEGVPPIGSPTDSPKAAEETLVKPMEEAGAVSKINSPGETSMTTDRNKMPPLEEEEAIAELDAAIDEAGDEGEEEPEPLDEVDIEEAAHRIKDDPMLHLVLGLTIPTGPVWPWQSVCGSYTNTRHTRTIGREARCCPMASWRTVTVSIKTSFRRYQSWGNCGRNPRSVRPDKTREWWCSNSDQSRKAIPPPQDRMPHRCISIARNSRSFSGPPLHSQSEITFEKLFFYKLSRSHRFNVESLSRFSLTMVKDGTD